MSKLPDITEIFFDTLSKLIEQSSTFISNLVSAVLILGLGWLIAKVTAFLTKSFFSKLGFDKLGDKILKMEALNKFKFDFKLSDILSKIVYILILLFISVSAADTLGVPAISAMFLMLVNFIPKLIVAIIMILVGLYVSDFVRKFVESLLKSFNISSARLIGKILFTFLSFISIILALGQAGINTDLLESSFNIIIAGFALAFAVGFGFASKDIMLNILSSIFSRKKIMGGDYVEIQGLKGTVIAMDNTTIKIETESGDEVLFPLRVLQTEKVIKINQNK